MNDRSSRTVWTPLYALVRVLPSKCVWSRHRVIHAHNFLYCKITITTKRNNITNWTQNGPPFSKFHCFHMCVCSRPVTYWLIPSLNICQWWTLEMVFSTNAPISSYRSAMRMCACQNAAKFKYWTFASTWESNF